MRRLSAALALVLMPAGPIDLKLDAAGLYHLLSSLEATAALADSLAARLVAGDLIALDGPLGAGKTTFVRALVAALDGDPAQVTSPTFTLLHCYEARVPVLHCDAYRLSATEDLDGLGFDELAAERISCIEWAQRLTSLQGRYQRLWRLNLRHGADATAREAELEGPWHE